MTTTEILSSRLLLATAVGLFSFVLGVFAFVRNPRRRLNLSFAAYNLSISALNLVGYAAPAGSPEGLLIYRIVQAFAPASLLFLLIFLQEFSADFNRPLYRWLRNAASFFLIISLPLYPTGAVIKEVLGSTTGTDANFYRVYGWYFPIHMSFYFILYLLAAWTTVGLLKRSSGQKRNQLKFVAFSTFMLGLCISTYLLSGRFPIFLWFFFTCQMAASFSLAYAIFKFQLFDFSVWMRRTAIFIGIYSVLLLLPMILLFPLRSYLFPDALPVWGNLAVIMIIYGILFSFAPALATYLQQKADLHRWNLLNGQLELVGRASAKLADERGLSAEDIAKRIVDVLKTFYWDQQKTPPQFILAAVLNKDGGYAVDVTPERQIDAGGLEKFMTMLADFIAANGNRPFGPFDISRKESVGKTDTGLAVQSYLSRNEADICCPCVHNQTLYGVFMLGAKTDGIYSTQEISTLQLAAEHVANTVRKSELILKTQELKDLDQYKKTLIANVTHEFKSPLAVIDGALDGLIDEAENKKIDPDEIREFVSIARNNVERLGEFIQNLLDIAQIEQSKVTLNVENADLTQLIKEEISQLKTLADQKDIRIIPPGKNVVTFRGDAKKIRQVVHNLLSNAIKFTDKGSIHFKTTSDGRRVGFSISDSGRGLSPEQKEFLFERFYQAAPGNGRQKGTGLGLAIAKGWTEAHQGAIRVESAGPGEGTTFFVEFSANN